MKDLPDNSVDLILCDLPFGVTDCEWDNIIPFAPLWEQYNRVAKDNAAVVLFAVQPFTTRLIQSNIKQFRYCWYWQKNNRTGAPFAKVQPMRCIEDICVFYKHKPLYKPQGLVELKKPRARREYGAGSVYRVKHRDDYAQKYTNYPTHLLQFANEVVSNRGRLHPTQKPVALLEYLIKTYTNEGATVLDNCMGSGSTGVACVNTNRNFIGIELNKPYYEIAKMRIRTAQSDELNEVKAA
jgi:site-specific DNA-methyltransferase (adenine-specific)